MVYCKSSEFAKNVNYRFWRVTVRGRGKGGPDESLTSCGEREKIYKYIVITDDDLLLLMAMINDGDHNNDDDRKL